MELDTFCIRIADTVLELKPRYPFLREYCAGYIVTGETPEFTVAVTREDIAFEQEKSLREAQVEGIQPIYYTPDYLETLAVYRKTVTELLKKDILLCHGSCIAVDGQAYLFTARSGTGKSTHTRLWRKMLGDRVITLNDDKPLLRLTGAGVMAYGTPWDGKHRLSTNQSFPLKAICALERGEANTIQDCPLEEIYPLLVQQIYRPQNPEALCQTLDLLDRMAEQIRFHRLHCNMNPEAAEVAYRGMK